MPGIFRAIRDEIKSRESQKDTLFTKEFAGFQSNGAVVLRNRRSTLKAEIPNLSEKAETLGNGPLTIYKPLGSKRVGRVEPAGPARSGRPDDKLRETHHATRRPY
jgi:hypothetical protein